MSHAPSYEEMKDSEYFWLQVTPNIAGMNETLDGYMEDEPIYSSLYYESKVTAIDDRFTFPFQELRVDILERNSEEIQSLSAKYPIGFVIFHEEGASVTLMCRSELVSRMVSTLAMVKDNEIEFFITLPVLPSKLPSVFPVLNFQYRVRSKSNAAHA